MVNRWKLSEESDENYELLTMSSRPSTWIDPSTGIELSTAIERFDRDPKKKQFEGQLEPANIKLSDAMATSAAALSQHMGKYDNSVEGLTRFHTLLGLEMGATMISDYKSVRNESVVLRVCWLEYLTV